MKENCELKFPSKSKDGYIKLIKLFKFTQKNDEIINFKVYNELQCSNCTFCQFQIFAIQNYLFLICVSKGTSNCIDLIIMNEVNNLQVEDGNEHDVILNKRIIKIGSSLGIVSSMKLQLLNSNLILLVIGTENGSCLIYTCYLKD